MSDKLSVVKENDIVELITLEKAPNFYRRNSYEVGDKFKVKEVHDSFIEVYHHEGKSNFKYFALTEKEYKLVKRSKLEDALRCMEDAVDLRKEAQKKDLEAIRLLNEYHEEQQNKTIEPTPCIAAGELKLPYSFSKMTDKGMFLGTVDGYRKTIVNDAKEEISNIDKKDTNVYHNVKFDTRDKISHYSVAIKHDFIVNREKRTVVCLLKGLVSGKVYITGKAKCSEDDVFNEHIGKIIAWYKATKQQIPEKYTNVPNPENIHDGDIIKHPQDPHAWEINNIKDKGWSIVADYNWRSFNYSDHELHKETFEKFKVIDDSNRK